MPVSLQLFDVSFAQTLHCTTVPCVLVMVLVTLLQLTVPLIGVHVLFTHVPVLFVPKTKPLSPTLSAHLTEKSVGSPGAVLFVLVFDQTGGVVSVVLSSLIRSTSRSTCEAVGFTPIIFIFQL